VLTPRREAFAVGLAKGLSQAAAYREAFPTSATWKDATVWRKASMLAADGEVQARVSDLQAQAAAANEVTLVEHVATLKALRDEARASGQFAAAIKAEELRGKCSGLYVERVQHSGAVQIQRIERVIIDPQEQIGRAA
jgi:hypothetical protein